jgi:twitching motility protein PilT
VDISDLLAFSVKNKASDLHLSAGLPPMIRVHGDIRKINVPALDHTQVHDMMYVRYMKKRWNVTFHLKSQV